MIPAFAIESGVKLPADLEVLKKRGRPPGLSGDVPRVVGALEPTQSVLFDQYEHYRAATRHLALLAPKRFVSRKTGDGWRVWRLQ